jgi:hypothetical protein
VSMCALDSSRKTFVLYSQFIADFSSVRLCCWVFHFLKSLLDDGLLWFGRVLKKDRTETFHIVLYFPSAYKAKFMQVSSLENKIWPDSFVRVCDFLWVCSEMESLE